ncbi:MAG: PQQ-dependent sugar dehydrogenase [Deltaproteobacteria bacterium]|nr:PQQ-dependent sugar dehydrogenase [Kofleriaceae bacterium]
MTRTSSWCAAALLAAGAAACGGGGGNNNGDGGGSGGDGGGVDAVPAPYCQPKSGTNLKLTLISGGFDRAVHVTAPAGDARLFVLEQVGRVRLIKDGSLVATPYLDLSDRVNAVGTERGLLGLAFHPRFAENGRLFVLYTAEPNGAVVVSELTTTAASDTAPPGSERVLMTVPHNYDNHNGGTVTFGPDGFLYISIGDGGGADNFLEAGQNPDTKLAKVLRIDVDSAQEPYGIPASNPWAAGGGEPAMYAWGLRNPYRISVDPATGDLYIGDVGQGWFEEVDYVPAGGAGRNFGWAVFEGPDCFTADPDGNAGCNNPGNFVAPLVADDRRNNGHCSVIGGHVYHGTCMPDLAGHYFYGDYCGGVVKTLRVQNGQAVDQVDRTDDVDPDDVLYQNLSGFGVDGFGELYVTTVASGRVYRIEVE